MRPEAVFCIASRGKKGLAVAGNDSVLMARRLVGERL
jgi:hypothetical protein